MNSNKLTIATIFAVSMAWPGVAHAEEPCGSGMVLDNFKSCEVIVEPECYEVCEPDAALVACVAEQSASCNERCNSGKSIECETICEEKCEGGCVPQVIPEEPEPCVETCEAKCAPSCAEDCKEKQSKIECAAMCVPTCSQACEESCDGGRDDSDDSDDSDDGADECTNACEESCYGSCDAGENRDCELDCQMESIDTCKSRMAETCTEWCTEGAVLVCDESVVIPDDINSCLGALEQAGVTVKGPVEAFRAATSPELATAGNCSVQDQAKLGLAGAFFTFAGFGLAAGFLRRRRRA